MPDWHEEAAKHVEHAVPQAPQCWVSVMRSTQAPPQLVMPAGQPTHTPLEHTGVVPEHTVPHAPQLPVSLDRVTHTPPHSVWPAVHPHTPFTQLAPAGQAVPQAPQLWGSVERVTQAPLQSVSPPAHEDVH